MPLSALRAIALATATLAAGFCWAHPTPAQSELPTPSSTSVQTFPPGPIPSDTPTAPDGPASDTPWVVSVGDSYISGEAGRWAGNSDDGALLIDAGGSGAYLDAAGGTAETIARCHRSTSAEIHLGGGVESENLACSGAETSTTASDSDGYFKPGIDFYDGSQGEGQALMLQDFAETHDVKMVAVSIGGNDFDFSSIVTDCVEDFLLTSYYDQSHCRDDAVTTNALSDANVAAVTARIATAYQNTRTAMRNAGYSDDTWTLMVQNYPSPLPPGADIRYAESGFTRQTTGGCGFWNADADFADQTLLPEIDAAVAAAEAQSGLTNIETMDISHAFDGHRLCESGVDLVEDDPGITTWQSPGASDVSEWVNQIRTATTIGGDFYIQESLHPDYWGQLALRDCLRQAYDGGSPRSGVCTPGMGDDAQGEPNMTLR